MYLVWNCFIKIVKYVFDCSGKVSLFYIRPGQSRDCGGFSEDGKLFNGAGMCFADEDIVRNKYWVRLVKLSEEKRLGEFCCDF